jgi:hypothetical protein
MRLWITDNTLRVSHWESQDYALDRASFGAGGFTLSISAASVKESRHPDWVPSTPHVVGKVVARDPIVYEIDLWGGFSLLAVQLEDLARLPLVINRCKKARLMELPWPK